jgi:hypothetical protein
MQPSSWQRWLGTGIFDTTPLDDSDGIGYFERVTPDLAVMRSLLERGTDPDLTVAARC